MRTRKKRNQHAPYSIHKCTLISSDPGRSCAMMKRVFGGAISVEPPPDKSLAVRGIRWVRFVNGTEFHFIPMGYSMKHTAVYRNLTKSVHDVVFAPMFDNHVGLYVPDLTGVAIKLLDLGIPCRLNRREDGMHQMYFKIDGCMDFMEVDSTTMNMNTVHKKHPRFQMFTFQDNNNLIADKMVYTDPNHQGARRSVDYHGHNVVVTGTDGASPWTARGVVDDEGKVVLDFSSKGGPSRIEAKRTRDGLLFKDGNLWSAVTSSFS